MSLREAAQQAHEALMIVYYADDPSTHEERAKVRAAITALRAALAEHDRLAGIEAIEKDAGIHVSQQAEPEQEPVAWMYDFLNSDNREEVIRNWVTQDPAEIEREKGFNVRPLYTAPTPRKPLTVFEIDAIAEHLDKTTIGWATHEFAAAIEKAHGIGEQHE